MPSGKILLVGETVEIQVEVMADSSGYQPVQSVLQSDDPSVAAIDGGVIRAVGAGSTHVNVVTDIGTEYVSVSVYPDAMSRDNADPWAAVMPEAPIYTDGRITIGCWLPPGDEPDAEVTVVGFLYNATTQEVALSVDQFMLLWPRSQEVRVPPKPGSEFDDSMWEGEPIGDSCIVAGVDEVGLGLAFALPDAVDWSEGWLIFDDGRSMILIPTGDIGSF